MVDLDSNKLTPARVDAELPLLPEPEGTILKNHLKQVDTSHCFWLLLTFLSLVGWFVNDETCQSQIFLLTNLWHESSSCSSAIFQITPQFLPLPPRYTLYKRTLQSNNCTIFIAMKERFPHITIESINSYPKALNVFLSFFLIWRLKLNHKKNISKTFIYNMQSDVINVIDGFSTFQTI